MKKVFMFLVVVAFCFTVGCEKKEVVTSDTATSTALTATSTVKADVKKDTKAVVTVKATKEVKAKK